MGVFWNVLIPLLQILILTIVFSQIMEVRLPGAGSAKAFAIYLCAGLLPWLGFSECVSRGTQSFLENATYLKKLPIPEQIFVAQSTVGGTLSVGISMVLLSFSHHRSSSTHHLGLAGRACGDPAASVFGLRAWADAGKPECILP
jgi:ABC-type polysaccharide/polyol phosphate export permease